MLNDCVSQLQHQHQGGVIANFYMTPRISEDIGQKDVYISNEYYIITSDNPT